MVLEFDNTLELVKLRIRLRQMKYTVLSNMAIRSYVKDIRASPARLMGSETCPKAPSRAQPCPDPGHNR